MLDRCLITSDKSSKELTGTKFSKNVKRRRKENELIAWAMEPLQALNLAPASTETAEEEDVDESSDDSPEAKLEVVQ